MSFRATVKKFIPRSLFSKIEPWGHLGEAVIFNLINGFPAKGLNVIGVTGTNGKTSTAFMIHHMLHAAGYKVGLMTTVGYGVGNDIRPQIEHMTTMQVPQLLKRIKELKKQGAQWLVLETTSHALGQNRVWGIPFSIAVMTNVTHEHLDYHGSFERYRAAKRKLFKLCDRNRKGLRTGVINADDARAPLFQSAISHSLTYGVNSGDLRAQDVKMTSGGTTYTASIGDQSYNITCRLPGSFNVYNSLAAVGVGKVLGLGKEQIEQGVASLQSVEGRMMNINEGQDFQLIVDYAHTPDSFEKLFGDLTPVLKGRLLVMFGSAGRRDITKREVQGELAGEYANEVIITEEDDRDENGGEILEQIAKGAEKAGKTRDQDLFLVHDRAEAINFVISRAKTGDTVLLLGKGHEKNIERAHGFDPWDEVATARQVLRKIKSLNGISNTPQV